MPSATSGRLAATVTLDSVPPALAIKRRSPEPISTNWPRSCTLAWSDSGTGVDPSTLVLTANGQR